MAIRYFWQFFVNVRKVLIRGLFNIGLPTASRLLSLVFAPMPPAVRLSADIVPNHVSHF